MEGGRHSCPTPCSPAHLNDLVSGRLFTEPKIEIELELVEELRCYSLLIGSESAYVEGGGGARLSRLPLDLSLIIKHTVSVLSLAPLV